MKIAFIGNFIPPFSTENERKWSFEQLGHDVIALQENEVNADQLITLMSNQKPDLLFYSHTHDPAYIISGLKDVFVKYKDVGIPTISVHLDRWAWLVREEDVGAEATWFTEYIFMADASPEAVELYEKHELRWFWLKPGVVARDCYMAKANKNKFPHEIIFTGSRGYHPEYPFRAELVDWLKEEYGDRFGHYGNDGLKVVREDDLNVLYASSKIVIGDSCFGGRPFYVSDRYYEVRGRGGFLLHPYVQGIDKEGVGYYESGNLDSLKRSIDYYLTHPEEREQMRIKGHNWVTENETYTNRAIEILSKVAIT